jgi:TatA/E family protein of Tat protein translocase
MEIALVVIITLLVVGPKRLPDLARSAGKGIREFKDAVGAGPSERKSPED